MPSAKLLTYPESDDRTKVKPWTPPSWPSSHTDSVYMFHRKLQTQPQRPMLGLPPIPHWANDADTVLELSPIQGQGAYMPIQNQPTDSNRGPAAQQCLPAAVASQQQPPQELLPTSLVVGPSPQSTSQLAIFGCKFDPVLGYILCEPHESLIPASMLKNHLSQEHPDHFLANGGRDTILELLPFLKHLYGLEPTQGYPGPEWELLHPIHKRVYAGRRCNLCPTFFHTNQRRDYSRHFEKHHGGMEKVDWSKLQFFNNLHQPFASKKLYLIPSQNNSQQAPGAVTYTTEPESLRLSPKALLDFPPPQFCQELGFVSWLESLGQQQVVLNYLTATPGTPITKGVSGTKLQLEKTLHRVHAFLNDYLSSGQSWLFIHHSRLQDILGKRYCSGFFSLLLAFH